MLARAENQDSPKPRKQISLRLDADCVDYLARCILWSLKSQWNIAALDAYN